MSTVQSENLPVAEMARRAIARAVPPTIGEQAPEVERALEEMADQLTNPRLQVSDLVAVTNVSRRTLEGYFRSHLDCSIYEFMACRRIEIAKELLRVSRMAVSEIAEATGFGSEKSFSRSFRRLTGKAPRDFISGVGTYHSARGTTESLVPRKSEQPIGNAGLSSGKNCKISPVDIFEDCEERRKFESRLLERILPRWCQGSPADLAARLRAPYRVDPLILFQELLREGIEGCREDRRLGVELIEYAVDLLGDLRDQVSTEELFSRRFEALIELGNAKRLASDYRGAELAFSLVRAESSVVSLPDRVRMKLEAYSGFLASVQGRNSEALSRLEQAMNLARLIGAERFLAKILIARGYALEKSGDTERAIECFRESILTEEHQESPDHYTMASAFMSLVNSLASSREMSEASACLEMARSLANQIDSLSMNCHLRWLEALLAHALGRYSEAVEAFYSARRGLAEIGETVNSAVLALDLSLTYLEMGDTASATDTVRENMPVFTALDLNNESLAAMNLLTRAVEGNTVTVRVLDRLRTCIGRQFGTPRRW